MNKNVKNIIQRIQSMGLNELETFKQKVYNSLMDVVEKDQIVSAIEERTKHIDKDDAMVEFSEFELD